MVVKAKDVLFRRQHTSAFHHTHGQIIITSLFGLLPAALFVSSISFWNVCKELPISVFAQYKKGGCFAGEAVDLTTSL